MAGRPSEFKPEYCERLVNIMSQGASQGEAAKAFGITIKTLYNWAEAYPEFKEAMSTGKEYSEAWWEDMGRKGIQGLLPKWNATGYIYTMKCRFKGQWQDDNHQKVDHTFTYKNRTDKELTQLIQDKLRTNVIDITPITQSLPHLTEVDNGSN